LGRAHACGHFAFRQDRLAFACYNHFKGQLLARRSYRGNLGVTVDALLSTDARRLINHSAV
jgi:hypothetical protein